MIQVNLSSIQTEGEFKIQCIEDESGTPQRVLTACIKDEVEVRREVPYNTFEGSLSSSLET